MCDWHNRPFHWKTKTSHVTIGASLFNSKADQDLNCTRQTRIDIPIAWKNRKLTCTQSAVESTYSFRQTTTSTLNWYVECFAKYRGMFANFGKQVCFSLKSVQRSFTRFIEVVERSKMAANSSSKVLSRGSCAKEQVRFSQTRSSFYRTRLGNRSR